MADPRDPIGDPDMYKHNNEPMDEHWEQHAESIFKWRCFLCNKPALSQLSVQDDFMLYGYYVYRDHDFTLFVRCKTCNFTYHYNCAKEHFKSTPSIEDLTKNHKPFKCEFNKCAFYDD